ncbi:MAG: hypothetical protein M3P46_10050 [Actinomycetota bacterium]|nr:hypothetical protein [Actinomycetota bacterium]
MTEPRETTEIVTPDGIRVQVPVESAAAQRPAGLPVPTVLRALVGGPVLAAAAGLAVAAVGAEVARTVARAWNPLAWGAPVAPRTQSWSGPGYDVRITQVEFTWPPRR